MTTLVTATERGLTRRIPTVTRPSVTRARHWARECGKTLDLPEGLIDDAETVVDELLANVLQHAPGEAEITLRADGHALTITCADRGANPVRTLAASDDDEHHRGMAIIDALCKERRVRQRVGGGKRVFVRLGESGAP